MAYETILYAVEGAIARLTFNRPDNLNAINTALIEETQHALRLAERDEAVRAILLTGNGRGFCSGADLASRREMPEGMSRGDMTAHGMDQGFNPLVRALMHHPKPIVAAVNGVTAGGGVGLALACDIVIAAKSATFVQVFAPRLGLVPDLGCTWFLPHLVGRARARGLALLGDRLPAEDAERWGLIWKCVEDAALLPTALEIATRLAKNPPKAMSAVKWILDQAETATFDEQLVRERDTQRRMGDTDDNLEGVMAFLQKREPSFKGR